MNAIRVAANIAVEMVIMLIILSVAGIAALGGYWTMVYFFVLVIIPFLLIVFIRTLYQQWHGLKITSRIGTLTYLDEETSSSSKPSRKFWRN